MLTRQQTNLIVACTVLATNSFALAQEAAAPDPVSLANAITKKFADATQYTFDATITFARRHAEDPWEVLLSSKIKFAVAPEGKFLLWVGDAKDLRYLIVSDGQSTWTYYPASNKYTKRAARAAKVAVALDEVFGKGVQEEDRDYLTVAQLVMPILSQLPRRAALIEMTRFAVVPYKGEDRQLPILSVLSSPENAPPQSLTDLVVDPENGEVVKLEWTKTTILDEEPLYASLKVEFEKLQNGVLIPPSYFTFSPGDDAQLVEDLPRLGLDGFSLLDRLAPDFEIGSVNGSRLRLSNLRNRPVLLAFMSNQCTPCRQQLEALASIEKELKDKGLAVYAVGSADKVDTPASLESRVLSDSDGRIARAYRVRFIPTIVLIDSKGQVIRFLWGARNSADLRAALKSVGL